MAWAFLLLVASYAIAPVASLTIGYQGIVPKDLAQVQQAATAALSVLQSETGANSPITNCDPAADYVSLTFNSTGDLMVDLGYTPESAATQPFVQLLLRAAHVNPCNGLDTVECLTLGPSFASIATHVHALLLDMGWTEAMLVATKNCNWAELATDVRDGLLAPNTKLNLLANGFGSTTTTCSDLPVDTKFVYLFIPQSLDAATEALTALVTPTAMSRGHVVIYVPDLSRVSLEDIFEALDVNGTAGQAIAVRLQQVLLVVGRYQGPNGATARLASYLPDTTLPVNPLTTAVFDATLMLGRVAAYMTCFSFNRQLATNYDFAARVLKPSQTVYLNAAATVLHVEEADLHMYRPFDVPMSFELRATVNNAGAIQYFDTMGVSSWRPYLWIEQDPELFPVTKVPVDISIAVAFGRTNPAFLSAVPAAISFAVAAVEYFNSVFPLLNLQEQFRDTFHACTEAGQATVNSNQHALLGAVISECSLDIMDELAPAGVLGITPGSTSVKLGNLTKYPTFYRLNPSSGFYGESLAIVLENVGIDCVTLLSDFEATANAEAAESFKTSATKLNIRIVQEFAIPPDATTVQLRALLLDVWRAGVGVIVLNSLADQAVAVLQVAQDMEMVKAGFLWVLNSFAAAPDSWPSALKTDMNTRLLTTKVSPPESTPLSEDFYAFFSSSGHRAFQSVAVSRPFTIGFADGVNVVANAAQSQLHTFGFGTNLTLTRQALVRGTSLLTANASIPGISASELLFNAAHDVQIVAEPMTMLNGELWVLGRIDARTTYVNISAWPDFDRFTCAAPPIPSALLEPPPAEEPSTSSRTPVPAVVGGVIGLLVLALLALLVLLRRNRRLRQATSKPHDFTEHLEKLDTLNTGAELRAPREFNRKAVELGEELSHGEFGTVHGGRLTLSKGETVDCAIKVLRGSDEIAALNLDGFYREAAMLAQFDQEQRIIKLYGVVTAGSPAMLLMEYCANGSMEHYLKQRFFDDREVNWDVKFRFAAEIADGMQFVATAGGLHMDLAARNVLITGEDLGLHCKIADFGMAKDRRYYVTRGNRLIPARWSAPEVLKDQFFSSASDVWSFGVTLYELATNSASLPYASMGNEAVMIAVLAGYRLERPPLCPESFYSIMRQCWVDMKERPSFARLYVQLIEARTLASNMNESHLQDPSTIGHGETSFLGLAQEGSNNLRSRLLQEQAFGSIEASTQPHPQQLAPRSTPYHPVSTTSQPRSHAQARYTQGQPVDAVTTPQQRPVRHNQQQNPLVAQHLSGGSTLPKSQPVHQLTHPTDPYYDNSDSVVDVPPSARPGRVGRADYTFSKLTVL
eukprot:m.233327 g.233327  ORF g.233327 m.233327 type:complete len:1317 (+) comp17380_c0_seq1:120-4070(+)